ncbi:rolling circle replication-associated protein [Arthrobacter bambusae]|uniref:rolling circle replication-associated protein n=1 Tax=Arthrobacter bambusae TaxID=1338426 RepID=UPI0027802614|nr:hypothetical protein [Arthrobacter bambusae]MDQ0210164.1 hypothetical protein [Arthrobacter bambusae]MDQ0234614.1 hypothetical protein [Arthrobacter bambusae]
MSTSAVNTSLGRLIAPDAGWFFTLYPDAGEGGGSFRSAHKPNRRFVAKGSAADPERSAAEAGRRAGATLRRYCAANRLNRLGTLTYAGAGCHDPQQLRSDVAAFFRDLRSALGGAPLPYAWVPEWHKTEHGLHVHFTVGRFIHRRLIKEAWGHGFVHIKLLGDLPVGSGSLSEARKAAGYLSKYVSKSFVDSALRESGLHRYDVAQGFQPARLTLSGRSPSDVVGQASEFLDGPPVTQWSSESAENWAGPPTIWAKWGA